ncbi:hypothetical protein EVAR_75358_1 [Eumeta japonica]|uniref:Uncharacterized protein n=1 Tax=Eumeta variegata TaxID=151549 RepID=A0A4C1YDM0_EUMVA|nr:hypothetical protein EVAR_75358_1 [Eumeta japonica]
MTSASLEQTQQCMSPAAQLHLATRISSPVHTDQAALVTDRRPSNFSGPPTAAVKATHITESLHADLTVHAADWRQSGDSCIQQQQSRQHASLVHCLHIYRSTTLFLMIGVHDHDECNPAA